MKDVSRRDAIRFAAMNLALSGLGAAPAQAAPDEPRSEPGVSPEKGIDLVFEGGGIKGAAFAGAIEVLEKKGFQYRRLVGTSAGAIVATCLAAGYKSDELIRILSERAPDGSHIFSTFLLPPKEPAVPEGVNEEFWKLFAESLFRSCAVFDAPDRIAELTDRLKNWTERTADVAGKFERLKTKFIKQSKEGKPALISEKAKKRFNGEKARRYVGTGLSLVASGFAADDGAFIAWMERLLGEKNIPIDITLGQFYERAAPIQLSLVATDVTGQQVLVLNNWTTPDVPLVQAVRMSMGIPMVWPEVEWKPEWGPYCKTRPMFDLDKEVKVWHRVVDGGVLSNFPLRFLLNDEHRQPGGVLGPPAKDHRIAVLGLLLDEQEPAFEEPTAEQKKRFAERLPVYQSASRLLDTMMSAWDKEENEKYKDSICAIGVKGFDSLDFDLENSRVETLIGRGRKAMEQFRFKT